MSKGFLSLASPVGSLGLPQGKRRVAVARGPLMEVAQWEVAAIIHLDEVRSGELTELRVNLKPLAISHGDYVRKLL